MYQNGILEFVLGLQLGDEENDIHLKPPLVGISVQLLLSHSKCILRGSCIIAGILLNMLIYLFKKKNKQVNTLQTLGRV